MSTLSVQISLEVMDTSECAGDWHCQDGRVTSCVGASRDPARWAAWADVVLLVYSVTSRASLAACNSFLQHCTVGHQGAFILPSHPGLF